MATTSSAVASISANGRNQVAFSGFAVTLALSILFPLLNYSRDLPIADFVGEWFSAMAFSGAALMLAVTLPRTHPLNLTLFLGPLALAAILCIHVALGTSAYIFDSIITTSYLLLLVLGLLVGQSIRASGLSQQVLNRIAWTLIITATLNFVFQVIQVLGFDLLLYPFVVPLAEQSACRIYGNVAQANQATMLASLAMGAAVFLRGIGRLRPAPAICILIVLLLSAGLAASRMAWLFLGILVALVVSLPAWPAERPARRWLALALILGFVLADYAARGLLSTVRVECASGLQRFADTGEAGFVIRAELWRLAIEIWKTSPWIGVGAGGFLGSLYEIGSLDRQQPFDSYAHNSALQILAEFGLIGAGVIAALTVVWLLTLVRHRRQLDAKDAVILAWLGVVSAYSMLEFPLWYVHFLLLFALLLGMLIRPEWNIWAGTVRVRAAMVSVACICLAGGAYVLRDYLALQRMHAAVTMKNEMKVRSTPDVVARIMSLSNDVRLYRLHVDHLLSLIVPLNKDRLAEKITDSERLRRRVPQASTVAQRATLAVLANDPETARYHVRRLFVFMPSVSDEIVGEMRALISHRPVELEPLRQILEEELTRAPRRRW